MNTRVGIISIICICIGTGMYNFAVAASTDVQYDMDSLIKSLDSNPKAVVGIIANIKKAGSDAPQVWESLPLDAQESVIKALEVSTVKEKTTIEKTVFPVSKATTDSNAAATVSCSTLTSEVIGSSLVGLKLWTYTQVIDRCYNGAKITSKFRTRRGTVYGLFWAFNGHIANKEAGGAGYSSYRAYTQGSFGLCAPYVACAQNKYPWIDQTVYGNGTYKISRGL